MVSEIFLWVVMITIFKQNLASVWVKSSGISGVSWIYKKGEFNLFESDTMQACYLRNTYVEEKKIDLHRVLCYD